MVKKMHYKGRACTYICVRAIINILQCRVAAAYVLYVCCCMRTHSYCRAHRPGPTLLTHYIEKVRSRSVERQGEPPDGGGRRAGGVGV